MKSLAVIAKLIDYPTDELVEAVDDIKDYVHSDEALSASDTQNLLSFLDQRTSMDLLDWQSDYDSLFERGRSLSLLIFEHIHGESRDRGQAMIDLIAQYKEAGLDLGVKELPDYIPLFLEFLSTQGEENAKSWLQDIVHILAVLKVRLGQRDCDYELLFETLVNISGADINYDDLHQQVKGEKRDDTKEAIDKVWEEEMVKFGPDSDIAATAACGSATNKPSEGQRRDQDVPIEFVDAIVADTLAKNAAENKTAAGGN